MVRRRSGAGTLWTLAAAAALVVTSCSSSGDNETGGSVRETTTTTSARSEPGTWPECPGDELAIDELTAWLVDVCPLLAEPGLIAQDEFLPAIIEENAPPPVGTGWDWPAVAQACEHLADSIPPIVDAASAAPSEYADHLRELPEVVSSLALFTEVCLESVPSQDLESVRAHADHLSDAGVGLKRLAEEIAEVLEEARVRAQG